MKSLKVVCAVLIGIIAATTAGCSLKVASDVPPQAVSSIPSETENASESEDQIQLYSSPSAFLDEDQYTLFEKAQNMEYPLWGLSDNLGALQYKIEDAPSFVPLTQNTPSCVEQNGHLYELYQNTYQEFDDFVHSIFTDHFLSQDSLTQKFIDSDGRLAVCDDFDLEQIPYYTGYVSDLYPDDFCPQQYYLVDSSTSQVDFVMVAYYDSHETYDNHETYSYEAIEKVENLVRMLKTESGWRIDEYHSPKLG